MELPKIKLEPNAAGYLASEVNNALTPASLLLGQFIKEYHIRNEPCPEDIQDAMAGIARVVALMKKIVSESR